MSELSTWLQAMAQPSDTILFQNEWLYLPVEAYSRLAHSPLPGSPRLLIASHVAPTSPLWPQVVEAESLPASLAHAQGRTILVTRADAPDLRAALAPACGSPTQELTFAGSHQNPAVTADVFAPSSPTKP